MFLNRQEQRQDNQNGVIFSGWLCSLLGRNAQGAYANEARSRCRLALLSFSVRHEAGAVRSCQHHGRLARLNNSGLGAE
jgi:hypothetical protein